MAKQIANTVSSDKATLTENVIRVRAEDFPATFTNFAADGEKDYLKKTESGFAALGTARTGFWERGADGTFQGRAKRPLNDALEMLYSMIQFGQLNPAVVIDNGDETLSIKAGSTRATAVYLWYVGVPAELNAKFSVPGASGEKATEIPFSCEPNPDAELVCIVSDMEGDADNLGQVENAARKGTSLDDKMTGICRMLAAKQSQTSIAQQLRIRQAEVSNVWKIVTNVGMNVIEHCGPAVRMANLLSFAKLVEADKIESTDATQAAVALLQEIRAGIKAETDETPYVVAASAIKNVLPKGDAPGTKKEQHWTTKQTVSTIAINPTFKEAYPEFARILAEGKQYPNIREWLTALQGTADATAEPAPAPAPKGKGKKGK